MANLRFYPWWASSKIPLTGEDWCSSRTNLEDTICQLNNDISYYNGNDDETISERLVNKLITKVKGDMCSPDDGLNHDFLYFRCIEDYLDHENYKSPHSSYIHQPRLIE